jgi:dolichol-phosphate mannosyltransferase
MNNALIIVPTYNERDNVEPLQQAIHSHCPQADILFVDDGSPDGTGELLDAMAAREPRVQVLHRAEKKGLGRAYIAGFTWALERHYVFIFEMDADFSHPPEALPRFLAAAEQADLVLGSRYIDGGGVVHWPKHREWLSRTAGVYVRTITGLPVSDPTGGFKCFRRAVLESIDLDRIVSNGYTFQIEMTHTAWRLGFVVDEVPIVFEDRHSGTSKMSSAIVREALWMTWKLWLQAGMRRFPGQRHARSVQA